MRVLLVHPSPLMYSELYLRLEPLGLERVAAAIEAAGHEVRLLDLQIFKHADYWREIETFAPQAVGFSVNYLANVPEVVDLAKETKARPGAPFVFVGGHSASFIAAEFLDHAAGAIDCIVRGEGEVIAPLVLEAIGDPKLESLPGVVTRHGAGPSPTLLKDLDLHLPARHLGRRRHKYFIGVLDPCASIEFTRGCPWDCSFCSAWTFYGRSYRKGSPEAGVEDLARIREPNVFIVDDVAFIQAEHGFAIAREIERRRIRKQYYLETRCDVLIKNQELFAYWKRLGLYYMFLGIEALDDEALRLHRKRVTLNENLQALEIARSLGLTVAINIIADPSWDEARFAAGPRLGAHRARGRALHGGHPLPRHRALADRGAPAHLPGLPPLRRAARGAAHQAPAQALLRGAGPDPGRAQPEAPGLGGGPQVRGGRAPCGGARADQLPPHALEVQHGLQPRAAVRRPPAAGPLRDAAPAPAGRGQAEQAGALRPHARRGPLVGV